MMETKYFCPFCAKELKSEAGRLHCERGDMTLTPRTAKHIRECIEDQPYGKVPPPPKSDPTDGFCPRCAWKINADKSGRLCTKCGLSLNPDVIRFLKDDHRHIGFRGIY